MGVSSNNLLANGNSICECVLVSVLRLEFYKMSRWSLPPCLNNWSDRVGTYREICGQTVLPPLSLCFNGEGKMVANC